MTAVLRRLRDPLARNAVVLTVFTLVANAANYLTNIVFGRLLSPVGYGELTALLALSVLIAIPTGAAQTIIAERVAVLQSRGDHEGLRWTIRYALGHVAGIGAMVAVGYLALTPLVIRVLDLRHPGPALALVPLVALSFIQPVQLGLLQGLGRFGALGSALLALAGSRIAFGAAWVLAGGGAGAAIGGQALGMAVVLLACLIATRRFVATRGASAARDGLRRRPTPRTISATLAFIGFATLANLDIVVAKIRLDPHDAGLYAALTTVGKIAVFLPSAVAFAVVPAAARAREEGRDPRRELVRSAVLVGAAAACVVIPVSVLPGTTVRRMFGEDYADAASGVLPIALAGAALAVLYLICTYATAVADRRWFVLPVAAIPLQVAAITIVGSSPARVAWAQFAVVAAVLVVNEVVGQPLVARPRRMRPRGAIG